MIRLFLATAFAVAFSGTFIGAAKADDPKPAAPKQNDKVRIAKDRAESMNNLKQIGLAFHNYLSVKNHFPMNTESEKGKALLSWRVMILPYVEQEALFKEFKLDEPWDSDHNKKLIEKMPKIYKPVNGKAEKGETYYRGFTGPGAMFEAGKKIGIADITDGTSNTIICVEAEKPCVWTKPDDLKFDPKAEKMPKLGGTMFENGFNALICDGSVRYMKNNIKDDTLKALITRNGGEVVQFP